MQAQETKVLICSDAQSDTKLKLNYVQNCLQVVLFYHQNQIKAELVSAASPTKTVKTVIIPNILKKKKMVLILQYFRKQYSEKSSQNPHLNNAII